MMGENRNILSSADQTWESIPKRCVFVHRLSLERLCQASIPLSEANSVPSELLSFHQALLQEAWTRLHHLQEYQAFGEALRAMGDWLEEVKTRLQKLESTEGNKENVEERLERVQVGGDRQSSQYCLIGLRSRSNRGWGKVLDNEPIKATLVSSMFCSNDDDVLQKKERLLVLLFTCLKKCWKVQISWVSAHLLKISCYKIIINQT